MKPFLPLLFILAIFSPLMAAEPSAFGAGNLDSDEPYGLTKTEASIYQNKKALQSVESKNRENSMQLQTLRERLDGLQTIIESLNDKAQSNKMQMGELSQTATGREEKLTVLTASVEANTVNIAALKALLETLAAQVDTINADYVSKEEYNRLVNEVNAFKLDMGKTLKSVSTTKQADPYAGKSNKALAKEAKANYDKLYFKYAIPQYEELIRRNYKPALAHYMIGEMWHYRKEWSKALSYFKESARLYDNASYMPTLMLHSAECMKHTGDTDNARKFLQAMLAKYPDANEASAARAMLNALP